MQPRLADTTEVIGTALASKAAGHGHRHIATEPSTLAPNPVVLERIPPASIPPR
jgi:hypothetical protein